MKDVSCWNLKILFRELEKINYAPELLCEGTDYNLDYLSDVNLYLDWEPYCRIMSNTRSVWNEDDYIRIGIQLVESKIYPFISALFGFFVSIKELYRMVTFPRKGVGNQYFRCIKATFSDIDKDHFNIQLELPEGYSDCPEFFLITQGFFIGAPGILKYGHSNVIMCRTDRGALYEVTLPKRNKPFAWLRQVLSFPSSKRAGARELNRAYSLLYERFNQLEESQAQIQKQARQLENQVDEIQKAILEERRRISSELHDDLATNLSAIALISGVMKQDDPGDKMGEISRIARQSLEKIGEIVWSLNPKNDKLENLVAYIRKYAMEYFEPTSIRCEVKLPGELPDVLISGESRRNVFYTVKEALYNIIKHAEATEAELKFTMENHHLSIQIKDNGIGFPKEELHRFGNGIHNMRTRMESIHGEMRIVNHQGTKITLTLPV